MRRDGNDPRARSGESMPLKTRRNRTMVDVLVFVALIFLLMVGIECFSAWKGW